jgi:hypothetical protein
MSRAARTFRVLTRRADRVPVEAAHRGLGGVTADGRADAAWTGHDRVGGDGTPAIVRREPISDAPIGDRGDKDYPITLVIVRASPACSKILTNRSSGDSLQDVM